jgi:hypothetical protein
VIKPNYVITNNQLYSLYSGNPLVMDVDHLKTIIALTPQHEVYILFEHTAYDSRAKARNPELYDYLFNNMEVIDQYSIQTNTYDDQERDAPQNVLTLARLRTP